jgi:hypothetical protein
MYLKAGDKVLLSPENFTGPASPHAPIWGSEFGYQVGTVTKTITGSHDRGNHCAMIKWDTSSSESGHLEEHLMKVTPDEADFSEDFKSGVYMDTMWILIRMASGRFVLNALEINTANHDNPGLRHALAQTRHALPTVDNNDYNLVNMMLSFPDLKEHRFLTVRGAVNAVMQDWGLPQFKSIQMPLQEFSTLREAAKAAPPTNVSKATVGLFTLPHDLPDLVVGSSE